MYHSLCHFYRLFHLKCNPNYSSICKLWWQHMRFLFITYFPESRAHHQLDSSPLSHSAS
jgi:hypothetical protein